MKPNLIKTVRAPDLRVISEPKPEALRTSTTPDIASQITQWMTGVVIQRHRQGAAVPGIQVAGKTGTAELGDLRLEQLMVYRVRPGQRPAGSRHHRHGRRGCALPAQS